MEKAIVPSYQAALLDRVSRLLPADITLVDALEELLELSTDSIYRRMRNETPLTINEVVRICVKYNISFDELISSEDTTSALFAFRPISNVYEYKNYLSSLMREMKKYVSKTDTRLIWAAGDPPVFQYFRFPLLAIFKLFYWFHCVVPTDEFKSRKFSISLIDEEVVELCKELYNLYASIPATEIWTDQTIISLYNQVDYVWQSGLFESKEVALEVCGVIHEQIDKMHEDAERSAQLSFDGHPILEEGSYMLYRSDIEPGSNTIFVYSGGERIFYLTHNILDVIVTRNNRICDSTERWLEKMIKMSGLISGISEKQRKVFFHKMKKPLEKLEERIREDAY